MQYVCRLSSPSVYREVSLTTRISTLVLLLILIWIGGPDVARSQTLTLLDAVATAERSSPTAVAARERVAEAEAMARQANALFYPVVRITSSYSQSDNPVNVFMYALNQGQFQLTPDLNDPAAADNWVVSGQAAIRLFSGGRDLATRSAAKAALNGHRNLRLLAVNELTMQVTRSYLQVLTSAEYLRSAQTSVAAYSESEKVMASRVDAGTALKTELLNIQVQLARSEERLLQAQNGYALAKEGLRLVMGLEELPASDFESLESLSIPEPTSLQAGDRPEVLAPTAFAEAAHAQLRAAKSGYLPAVNAFASIDRYQGWEYDGDKSSWSAGLSLEWTLFDGFYTQAAVSEKRATLKAAQEAVRQSRLQTSVELRSADFSVREATQRVAVMDRAVRLARESSDLTRQRFAQGLALSSHVIDAEDSLVQAEFGLAQARADRLLAIATLRRALALPITGDPQS